MQQRQTVLFGTLIAGLLFAALFAGAVWAEIIPSPVSVEINDSSTATPTAIVPPCPPEGQLPVPYSEIIVNVLNGTDRAGLAGSTAAVLAGYGFQRGSEANGSPYTGVARISSGPTGVGSAYTLASLFSESQIQLDTREDATVDVLVGERFESILSPGEIALDPDSPIPAPASCTPVVVDPPAEEEEA